MARRLIINRQCSICGKEVDVVPDSTLRENPHRDNVEYVVTHLGRKQYIHTNCWYGMIEEQKKKRNGLVEA